MRVLQRRVTNNGDGLSSWGDKKCPKLDSDDGCTALNGLKTSKLNLKRWL